MFKYTKHTLKKLETLLQDNDYIVRYEKGNFSSGYCILFEKQVVIVNQFLETEGRINSLLNILEEVDIDQEKLSDKSKKFYRQIQKLNAS